MSRYLKRALGAALVAMIATVVPAGNVAAAPPSPSGGPPLPTKTIVPAAAWSDDTGRLVQAHGAGITKVGDTYYMVGEDKATGPVFHAVSCYSSKDLTSWRFEGHPLTLQASGDLGPDRIVERPKVIYNDTTRQYVMYLHIDDRGYQEAKVGVATSPTPCGPYTYLGSSRPLGFQSRDINLFKDEDGTAYLLTEDRANGLRINKLSPDYLSVESNTAIVGGLESPAMVKVNGRYMLFGSHLTGWSTNDNEYATATSLSGPWSDFKKFAPAGTRTFDSQTSTIVPVTGTQGTSYLYVGDRWKPTSLFDSLPVWLPIELDGTTAKLNWYDSWSLNPAAGTWSPQSADAEYEAGSSTKIHVPRAGTYTVKLSYTNGDATARRGNLTVDARSPIPLYFPPTGDRPGTATTTVFLSAGDHTVAFGNNAGPAPDLDKISLPNGPATTMSLAGASPSVYPGQSVTVTQTFTNADRFDLSGVKLSMPAPAGWTVEATSPTTFDTVAAGTDVQATWRATLVSPGASSTGTLTGTANYTWGGDVQASFQAQETIDITSPLSLDTSSSWIDPGQSATVTETYTNHGEAAVSDVKLALQAPSGWTAEATSPVAFDSVAGGASVQATFKVSPAAPDAPIVTRTLTGTVSYAFGNTPVSVQTQQTVRTGSPVQAPYRTTASTEAYFGQVGDKLAIAAAGADTWSWNDEFGAIYLPGAVTESSTAVVRLDSQEMADEWGKSGLMVRNDMTKAGGSAGYLILAVTPQNGIALQWDSSGDGYLDSNINTGSSAPVYPTQLKLVRNGTTYTGSYSTDGQTWKTVGTATLPTAATTQDVGVFTTSHKAGTVRESDFSGFTVS